MNGCPETGYPAQETGVHRNGERNVHPYQNDSFGQVLCVRKTYTQSYAVDLTGQLASYEKRPKHKPNVDMKNYLPILEKSPHADIAEVNEARAKLEKTTENYMLRCSGTREKTLLAFQIWKAITIL